MFVDDLFNKKTLTESGGGSPWYAEPEQGMAEAGYKRDAYQRDYDNSVAGMGKRQSRAYQDDGGANDERHDLDPSDWYFVKDGKMFAISVYPNQEQQAISLGYSRTRAEAKAKAGQQGVAEGTQVDEVFNIVPNLEKQIEKKEDELKALKAKMASRTATDAGIQTGATALIDPETNQPYEKDKLASLYGYKEPEAAADDAQADNAKTPSAQTPAQIRAAKQKAAAATAQGQMSNNVPATVAQTPAQIRAAKQKAAAATAQGQMSGNVPDTDAQTSAPTSAPTTATQDTNPIGFDASNVMKLPGMEKYAKPAAPAKTANFAGPSGYGKTTTSINPPAAPSSPALAVPKAPAAPRVTSGGPTPAEKANLDKRIAAASAAAPAVAETIAQIDRMLESVNSKKSAEMVKAYVDQKFTELGLRNTTECRNIMAHVVQESAIRRRQYAQSLAK
jgi:hypothetical protein